MRAPVNFSLAISLFLLLSVTVAGPVEGQASTGEPVYETREELLDRERTLANQLTVARDADRVRAELQRVRRRLEEGDFRPGDALEIRVPGSDTLSGVFQVESDARLRLPVIGDVDLSGVLYAEADSVLRSELSRYVRAERIDVRPLKRVAVLGAIGSPGYYDVPPSMTLSDLLMEAGGPTQSSNLDKLEIRRDGERVASAEDGGLRESATLVELGVRRGDQIRVPATSRGSSFTTVLAVLGTVSSVVWATTRIF